MYGIIGTPASTCVMSTTNLSANKEKAYGSGSTGGENANKKKEENILRVYKSNWTHMTAMHFMLGGGSSCSIITHSIIHLYLSNVT